MQLKIVLTSLVVTCLPIIIWLFYPQSIPLHLDASFYQLKQQCGKQINSSKINIVLRHDEQIIPSTIFLPIAQTSQQHQYFFYERITNKQINAAINQLTKYHLGTIHFITVIINAKQYSESQKAQKFQKIIGKVSEIMNNFSVPKSKYVLKVHQLKQSIFQQNFLDKLNDPDYTNKVIQEFIKSGYMSQCRYTYQKCENYLIYEALNYEEGSYYESEGVYIVPNIKNIKQIILDIMNILPIIGCINVKPQQVKGIWYKIQYGLGLEKKYSQIQYLEYIKKHKNNYMSSFQEQKLILNWVKQSNNFIQFYHEQNYEKLWKTYETNILQDQNIGRLNLFPSDYQIGVFVPILVLALYPLLAFGYYLFHRLIYKKLKK